MNLEKKYSSLILFFFLGAGVVFWIFCCLNSDFGSSTFFSSRQENVPTRSSANPLNSGARLRLCDKSIVDRWTGSRVSKNSWSSESKLESVEGFFKQVAKEVHEPEDFFVLYNQPIFSDIRNEKFFDVIDLLFDEVSWSNPRSLLVENLVCSAAESKERSEEDRSELITNIILRYPPSDSDVISRLLIDERLSDFNVFDVLSCSLAEAFPNQGLSVIESSRLNMQEKTEFVEVFRKSPLSR